MKNLATALFTIIGIIFISLSILNQITMKHLKTEIILTASPEKVFKTLIDVNNYEHWNPFIVSSKGEAFVGQKLTNTMLNKGKANTFNPIVTKVEKNKEFEWLGTGLAGMFKGRHYFILEDLGNGQTKLIHGEQFSGLLSGLILKMIGEDTLNNFHKMNEALKAEVERNTTGLTNNTF